MSRISVILMLLAVAIAGCGDEEQGFPNPLHIEILEQEEETPVSEGSVTGQILFTDTDNAVQAYALSSNEYVTLEGESKKTSGEDLDVFVDFPSNNNISFLGNGFFQIKHVDPGTHELILMPAPSVIVATAPGASPEDSYAEIDVPASRWLVTVEPGRNTATGLLMVVAPGLAEAEWKSGEAGQEIIIPQEPEKPTVPTIPTQPTVPTRPIVSTRPLVNPGGVANGHIYLLDDVSGNEVSDDSANDLTATIAGDPQIVAGLSGNALYFDGIDDAVHIPDSQFINITNGPWSNRTVMAVFNCANVNKPQKQTIYEEGGTTRGINIYIFEGEVYAGIWNRAEYNAGLAWEGSWISAPIGSNQWHAVALVLRDASDSVEDDRFEMWMDGQLVAKEPAGQIYNHSADNGIGDTNGDTYFHDGSRSGSGDFFEGIIDEVWILNEALSAEDFRAARLSVELHGKLASSWGAIRTQR